MGEAMEVEVYVVKEDKDIREGHHVCPECGDGTLWTVVFKPEDCAIGQSFEDKETAEDLARYMNEAYRKGVESDGGRG